MAEYGRGEHPNSRKNLTPFKEGNPGGGRPRGSRDRLARGLISSAEEAFIAVGGPMYLVALALENKPAFVNLLIRLATANGIEPPGGDDEWEDYLEEMGTLEIGPMLLPDGEDDDIEDVTAYSDDVIEWESD